MEDETLAKEHEKYADAANEGATKREAARVISLPISARLDAIDDLGQVTRATTGKSAVEQELDKQEILLEIASQDTSPIVKYACILSFDRLGDRVEARPAEPRYEHQLHEPDRLSRQIDIGQEFEHGEKLYQVASDAVGIFDNRGLPQKIARVDFEQLESKRTRVGFFSYDSISEDAFLNPYKKNEPELSLLLKHLHQPELRSRIEKDLKIDLAEIPLRSQIHLLRFLSGQDAQGFTRLREVLRKHPKSSNEILNSFLANAEDEKYGEAILRLGENLRPEAADEIFIKYDEIAEASEKIRGYLEENFFRKGEATDEARIEEVMRHLLHRGNELLLHYSEQKGTDEKVLQDMEQIKTEVLLFASAFKTLSSERPVSLSEIRATELHIKDVAELTDKEKHQMLQIYSGNREDYAPARLEQTTREFQEVLSSKNKEFQLLFHNGELLAFIRFDELPNGNLYAGSLNVRPEARDSSIGMALLRATLDKKAEHRNIEAVAYSKLPMLKHYLSDFGFQIAGELPNYHGGELYYRLFRPKAELH